MVITATCLAWGAPAPGKQSLQQAPAAPAAVKPTAQTPPLAPLAPLATGTLLYLRLDTAVSTTASHLRQAVTAHVVREVPADALDGAVAIPLGTTAQGEIAMLIPSSNPTDRARLRLNFIRLTIPGEPPAPLAGHVTAVPNARETVLADGTIQGVLASELPATRLQDALGKLGQARPDLAGAIGKIEGSMGKATTAIEYAASTDLVFVLDKPFAADRLFPPAASTRISSSLESALENALAGAPQRSSGKDGKPGDPLNLMLVGTSDQVQKAFADAGWVAAERKNSQSILDTVRAVINDGGYGRAPVSDLYLYGRREDFAFEKMLNTFTQRHHLRLWRTASMAADGRDIWLGAATHDVGFDLRSGSHAIDPDLDAERAQVGADLEAAGAVTAEQLLARPNPATSGITATGGIWRMDGQLLVIDLKSGRRAGKESGRQPAVKAP